MYHLFSYLWISSLFYLVISQALFKTKTQMCHPSSPLEGSVTSSVLNAPRKHFSYPYLHSSSFPNGCRSRVVQSFTCLNACFFIRTPWMEGLHSLLCIFSIQDHSWHVTRAHCICFKWVMFHSKLCPWTMIVSFMNEISGSASKMNWCLWCQSAVPGPPSPAGSGRSL